MLDSIFNDAIKYIEREHLANDLDQMAGACKLVYDSFKKAGFTPNQSLELTKEMIRIAPLMAGKGAKK